MDSPSIEEVQIICADLFHALRYGTIPVPMSWDFLPYLCCASVLVARRLLLEKRQALIPLPPAEYEHRQNKLSTSIWDRQIEYFARHLIFAVELPDEALTPGFLACAEELGMRRTCKLIQGNMPNKVLSPNLAPC